MSGSSSEEFKKIPFPFACSPAVCEWLWKKTQIEKKDEKNFLNFFKIKSYISENGTP